MQFNEAPLPSLLNQTFTVRNRYISKAGDDSPRYKQYEQDSQEYWRVPNEWPKINHVVDRAATKTRAKLSHSLFVFPFDAANEREERGTR